MVRGSRVIGLLGHLVEDVRLGLFLAWMVGHSRGKVGFVVAWDSLIFLW